MNTSLLKAALEDKPQDANDLLSFAATNPSSAVETAAGPSDLRAALLKLATVNEEILNQAAALQQQTGRPIGQTLLDMGVLAEEQLYAAYAEVTGLSLWQGKGEIREDTPFTQEFLLANTILPIQDRGKNIYVIADALDDGLVDLLLRFDQTSQVAIYPEAELSYRLKNHFDVQDADGETFDQFTDIEHLKDLALEAPIIRQVNDMILNGVKMNASDIHLEPLKNKVNLRYRVDGVLHARPAPNIDEYPAVVSRVKILANLDIAERRLPQDGRFSFKAAGKDVDIRVSTVPTSFGEDIALRLLDQQKQSHSLATTGLSPQIVQSFQNILPRSHGLVLVTGPTGSGKTTTLYAGLREIIDGSKKIITVEDPVEYDIPGIAQIQVNADIGMSFAQALRSILRHDPDVILIGEIRDRETAEIAVQAALTGHLVLSTIHTNSAIGAVARLLNMGIPDYLVASSLLAVTGQRLVRQLCPHCRNAVTPNQGLAQKFKIPAGRPIFEPKGCDHCGQIGYKGRLPIAEFLENSDEIRNLILEKAGEDQILRTARQQGFATMLDDGIYKVTEGATTLDEVLRVAG